MPETTVQPTFVGCEAEPENARNRLADLDAVPGRDTFDDSTFAALEILIQALALLVFKKAR